MCVCNVRKPHRPHMSDAFLGDTVDTTLATSSLVVKHLRCSVNCAYQLASLERLADALFLCDSWASFFPLFHCIQCNCWYDKGLAWYCLVDWWTIRDALFWTRCSFCPAMLRRARVYHSMSSVCASVTFRYRDHIGWNTSKIISRLIA